ncbi:MAG: type I 3-dehydroquinate dehydratase [Candidatus Omnitrophota bacterium]
MKKKMLKLGKVSLGSGARIVLVIPGIKDFSIINKAKAEGADILELRFDEWGNILIPEVVKTVKIIQKKGLPLIGTIRSIREGAKKRFSEKQRLELFEAIIPLVDAVDIELSSELIRDKVIKRAKESKKKVIVSYHNFKNTPSDKSLRSIIHKAKAKGADIVKIAALAKNQDDIIRLLELTLDCRDKNLITIAMGKKGAISRVLFPLAGSLLTYSCIGKPLASGQIPLDELRRQLYK